MRLKLVFFLVLASLLIVHVQGAWPPPCPGSGGIHSIHCSCCLLLSAHFLSGRHSKDMVVLSEMKENCLVSIQGLATLPLPLPQAALALSGACAGRRAPSLSLSVLALEKVTPVSPSTCSCFFCLILGELSEDTKLHKDYLLRELLTKV